MSQTHAPVAAIIQTRMTSSRLPGKVLKPLAGAPLIRRMIERVQRIAGLDMVVVALAEGRAHDPVLDALDGLGITVTRGPEEDVLARMAGAARAAGAATVVRITSDCPLIDPAVSASVLAAYRAGREAGIRYARTAFETGFPHGFDTEAFDAECLYEADAAATDAYEREHVTPYIWRRPGAYPAVLIDARPDRRAWRLTVDTQEDYELVSAVYDALYPANPEFGYRELCTLFEAQPDLLQINANAERKTYAGLG